MFYMAVSEEKILSRFKNKLSFWWRYTDHIFFVWNLVEESLKEFIFEINSFHLVMNRSSFLLSFAVSQFPLGGKFSVPLPHVKS